MEGGRLLIFPGAELSSFWRNSFMGNESANTLYPGFVFNECLNTFGIIILTKIQERSIWTSWVKNIF